MNRVAWGSAALSALLIAMMAVPSRAQNLLTNGDFEAPPILGAGQTPVAPNTGKPLISNPAHPGYLEAILGIPSWLNSFTDVGFGAGIRDAGLMSIGFDFVNAQDPFAFINNWETRLSQTTPHVLAPGESITASISVGLLASAAAGRLQLWAGEPTPANPDVFPASSVLLSEFRVGGVNWSGGTPNQRIPFNAWTPIQLSYVVPASGAMLGKKLTVSLITTNGSEGPTIWDDAVVSVLPEPSTGASAACGLLAFAVRRGRRRRSRMLA